MLRRLERIYGVTQPMLEAALKLPDEKIQEPQTITPTQKNKIFGEETELIDTSQEQMDIESETGNGNGRPRPSRRDDQIDLAFFQSHEFSVLRAHSDPLELIGNPPFKVYDNQKNVLFETELLSELHNYLIESSQKGITLQRYKGLGEMNADQLKETTMDPEKRTLLQVVVDDMSIAGEIFETLMGDQVEPRKKFIEKHAAEVKNLDI